MATLANVRGSSFVPDIGQVIADTLAPIGERVRGETDQADLEGKVAAALGIGQAPAQDASALGRLGQLSPQLAQAIGQANPQEAADLRTQAQDGMTLATELQGLPDHASRLKRLAQEAGTLAASGGDLNRLVALSNMDEAALGLELQRMQIIGEDTLTLLPQQKTQAETFAALIADNPQVGTALLGRRDQQVEAERARQAAAARAAQQARAAAAAAAGPQGAFAQGLAEINGNFERGHITAEDREQRIANLRTEFASAPVVEFDPDTDAGKFVNDRMNLVAVAGEDSPEVLEFDMRVAGSDMAANLGMEDVMGSIESTRLANEKAAAELADPTADLNAKEQQILRIMNNQNVDRATAQGLADGVIKLSNDPVTGEDNIVNVATGTTYKPTPIGDELPSTLPPSAQNPDPTAPVNANRAFGSQGFGINAINTIVGAITGGQVDQATDEAVQAVENLNTRTMLSLSAAFPGRPSNLTREKIEEMTASPANVFTGRARALVKMKQMRTIIGDSLRAADDIARGEGGNFTAQARGEAAAAVRDLTPLFNDYDNIIGTMEGGNVIPRVVNQAEYDSLPSGTTYIHPDGDQRVKQ